VSSVSRDWAAALAAGGWSRRELWLACFALGADASLTDLDEYLDGERQPDPHEHNMIAVALNERLHDLGLDSPVPYRDRA
jgi:hypothetical protein